MQGNDSRALPPCAQCPLVTGKSMMIPDDTEPKASCNSERALPAIQNALFLRFRPQTGSCHALTAPNFFSIFALFESGLLGHSASELASSPIQTLQLHDNQGSPCAPLANRSSIVGHRVTHTTHVSSIPVILCLSYICVRFPASALRMTSTR